MRFSLGVLLFVSTVSAQCPYMEAGLGLKRESLEKRQSSGGDNNNFLEQFYVDDSDAYLTSDSGTPIEDQDSLKAGDRGPTLLEDFIFREKITRFDHERVPERAVHARGAGAHGVFESYGNWSNITAASFLNSQGKQTPVFLRFSTVAGSRGSADTVRDVHGFAVRLYTDEGNFDIVGNNIPVFFIQDAIRFPDLIHAVKPSPDNEIPQAATAHDSAWDFFSQQPSALHTLMWALSGHGTPRSFRHMDGFGVHTYRFVTDDGSSKFVKFRWQSQQGLASLVWEEAQIVSGKNSDFHRADLFNSIAAGNYPEWELQVQIIDENDALSYGFDVLDPTKIVPEEYVPFTPLGRLTLNQNPTNYFAETEQVMFQPGHIVRGIDFSEDPLLQGRIFSYLDTQLNRHGGPNFEQIPINRPHVVVHNNHRDGAAQNFIQTNKYPYSPKSFNNQNPRQATQQEGRGFFTSPTRQVSGRLVRALSSTFSDVWSQPRLFLNSLEPVERQMIANAARFELAQVQSTEVRQNVLTQFNRVSHELAVEVAAALGMTAPDPDPTYYTNNSTASLSVARNPLNSIAGLTVGVLVDVNDSNSISQATSLASAFAGQKVSVSVIGQRLAEGVNTTYSVASAAVFDGIIITSAAAGLLSSSSNSTSTSQTLYPDGRPAEIVSEAYRWGKPVGILNSSLSPLQSNTPVAAGPGVFATEDTNELVSDFGSALKTFKFFNRFAVDSVFASGGNDTESGSGSGNGSGDGTTYGNATTTTSAGSGYARRRYM